MRKNYALISAVLFIASFQSSAQVNPLAQISASYYRSDPFVGKFSGFLQHLINDPQILGKETARRTDTSLFYFYGVYKDYNPFFFKPKRLEVLLQEVEVQYADSTNVVDTVMVYQLMAYNDLNEKGQQEIRKEFDKIHRQYHKKFHNENYKDLLEADAIVGGVHNYFELFYALAPFSIAWKKMPETKEIVLNLTLRMKTSNNEAVLAAPFYQTK